MSLVDTHIHVFVRGLPLAPVRRYVPDYNATYEDYQKPMQASGITHAVIVQPSFLGTDNSYMCGVLRQHRQQLRGIAVVDPAITEAELQALEADGVVGLRLNLDGLALPKFDQGPWPDLLAWLRQHHWQVEIHREAQDLPELIEPLLAAGVTIVIDHFGRPDDELGAEDPGFQALLEFGASGRVWAKLSGAYRNGREGRGFAAAPRQAQLLLEHLGPDRLVWGSDWPHTRHESYISVERMRRCLDEWVTDPALRERIMGQNALELFRF